MKGLRRPSLQLQLQLRPTTLSRSLFSQREAPRSISAVLSCRYSSSAPEGPEPGAAGVDIAAIRAEMLGRTPQVHFDMMTSVNSIQLNTALSDFIPEDIWQRVLVRTKNPQLPLGHHLVYFPLHRRGSDLCPDGTDPFHSPRDTPFTRRMWAGGSIRQRSPLYLTQLPAYCLERIVDVQARGPVGHEKIFVQVLREYAPPKHLSRAFKALPPLPQKTEAVELYAPHSPNYSVLYDSERFGVRDPSEYVLDSITERRTLVFMRERSDEEKKANLEQEQRIVKAPTYPDYSITLTPTPALLFHYSALTYNAHRIHLDRSYCREAEGYQDLLVHGPLSLTLMLTVLYSRLKQGRHTFDSIDYRHLAPLYVGQPMRICVKRQKVPAREKVDEESDAATGSNGTSHDQNPETANTPRSKWDLWVEDHRGGLCVKGTAEASAR
ncbi:hypothetical protein F4808DRAFT_422249 [Astrocystis sublimbata]|nr:hypothetical protein F4808DRAFT_422249 [Astrocystis sublimbata]